MQHFGDTDVTPMSVFNQNPYDTIFGIPMDVDDIGQHYLLCPAIGELESSENVLA